MKHLSEAEYGQIQPFLDRNVMARVATKGGPGGPLAPPQNIQDCLVLVIIFKHFYFKHEHKRQEDTSQ